MRPAERSLFRLACSWRDSSRSDGIGKLPWRPRLSAFLPLRSALTGGLFALQYRSYYAQWHEPALTIAWSIQFVHTVATAFYQFIVLGIRLYFPLGFIALALASIWFARQQR